MLDLVLVTAPGCRYCAHARALLDELSAEFALRWREVALDSDEGRDAATRWRPPFPPLLLADGSGGQAPLGHGRLSRRRLARQLTQHLADAGGERTVRR